MNTSGFNLNIAVVIGINDYQNGIPTLGTARQDAEAIAKILKTEYQYQVQLITDTTATPATSNNLKRYLETELPEILKQEHPSRLLFYFAGHGIALNGDDGPQGYLILQDAKLGDVSTYLPMQMVAAAISKLSCRHCLVILDCCFAGAFRWSSTRKFQVIPETIHQERYDRFIQDPAWQVITSAASDQYANDSLDIKDARGIAQSNTEHSPFAAALIDALSGNADAYPPAANGQTAGDGVITASELYLYLRDAVEIETTEQSQRQTPGIWPLKNHDKGEYIFLAPGHPLNLPPAPPLDESKNPYRGLESFEEEHSAFFFGRTASINKLSEFVSSHPLTVVLGASGSGKSSLVKAGLVPFLKQKLALKSDRQQWQMLAPFRPGESPLKALNHLLVREKLAGASITQLDIAEKVASLSSHLEAWSQQHPDSKLLLVIDQFEELITLCKDEPERSQFLAVLAQAVAKYPQQLRLVLTLRSDFEPQFRDTALQKYWQASRFVIAPMTRADLREAIEKPAEKQVMYFEPHELVEQSIDEVADTPGALPLLSFGLSELYLKYLKRQRQAATEGITIDRALTQADYQDLGGVIRSLTQRADEEYVALIKENPAYAQIIRQVMLRMIAIGGGELARRRVPLSELEYPAEKNVLVKEVIERFTKARLLVKGEDADKKTYVEPAHNVLVRGWHEILKWKQEEEQSLILQRRLTPAAEEWKDVAEKKQSKGFLAKAEPAVIDGLDRGFYAIENLLNKTGARFKRLWKWSQRQQARSREQFLWNTNPYLDVLNEQLNSNNNWFNQVEAEFVQQSVLQKRRNIGLWWLLALGFILLLSGSTFWALINLRKSMISQMLTKSESAFGKLGSNQLVLDALIDSLSAGSSLKNEWLLKLPPPQADEQSRVIKTLRKAVYTVREYYKQEKFPSGVQSIFWQKKDSLLNSKLLVVSTENDGTVRVLDKQANELAYLRGDGSKVTKVIFSPNGSQLAIGNNKGNILLWNWENQQQAVLQKPQGQITSLSFDRDGGQLVSVGDNGIACRWNLGTNQCQALQVPRNKIITAGFQPNGKLLLVTKTPDGKTLSVFNSSFQQLSKTKQLPVSIDRAILSPKSEDIVITYKSSGRSTVGSESYLWHWRKQNNSQGDKLPVRPDNISFSLDGKQLAATEFNNGTIRLLDSETKSITELKGHQGQVASFNFRPDGKVLATASADGTLRLWALQAQPLSPSQELPGKANSLTFSRDGQKIATQAVDGTVRLLDLSGKQVQQFDNRYPVFKSLSFSPNGKQLATLSNEGTAGILDLSNGQYTGFIGTYDGSNLTFSPDGQQLAVNDHHRKTVYVLDVSSGQPNDKSFSYEKTISIANAIWKSDDQILLSGVQQPTTDSKSKSIVLLKRSGIQLQTITEHLGVGEFSGISSNSDGSLAALVRADGTGGLWYLDGTQLGEFKDPDRQINSVILSPDSSMLATIGEDGTTKLWEIGKLDKLLSKGCNRDGMRDYLQNNPKIGESDPPLCAGIPPLPK
jgi:WD40 repeat protein